jgi:hypothetical protein
MTTSDNGNHKHKKRPRPSDYYDRLLFQCQKDLHKHAKQTKQFEVQKLIRQLKCIPDNDDHQAKNRTALSNKLQELKDYDLEPVVQECVRQLGLVALNPNLGSTSDGPSSTLIGQPLEPCWMRDRIVHHARLKATIEKWHEEVTKYRRWSLVKSEKEEGSKFVSRENSLFVQLGAAPSPTTGGGRGSNKTTRTKKTTAEDPVDASYYGPAGGGLDEDGGTNRTKKNRQGQRARKAKALAVAARKEGRMLLPEESVNWRPAKKNRPARDDEEALSSAVGGRVGAEERRSADIRRHRGPTRDDDPTKQHSASSTSDRHNNKNETLHPSWQARKDKKDCIVAFQGKKITF